MMFNSFISSRPSLSLLLSAVVLAFTGCTEPNQTADSVTETTTGSQPDSAQAVSIENVRIDGSSTVYPVTEAAIREFETTRTDNVRFITEFSGTGGGFKKFCAGETDINNASRPIKAEEIQACRQTGVQYVELPIAYDALTVVANPKNDWADSITVAELKKIWEPAAEEEITRWNQIRTSWPDRPLHLYVPGQDSGTFDYFTETIIGEAKVSRNDFTDSEDDEILVQGVSRDKNALGYFGYAYYKANQDKLKVLAIDNGNGPVMPSPETVENGTYQPLSRPLFLYVSSQSLQRKPILKTFTEFYLQNAASLVNTVGYVPLPEEGYRLALDRFRQRTLGTVFAGQTESNLTIQELLRKQSQP